MSLPVLFLALALAPAGSRDAAEPWREHEAECHRLADGAVTPQGVSAGGLVAAGDACRRASEDAPTLASRAVLVLEAATYYRRAYEAGDGAALCTAAVMLRTLATQLAAPAAENLPNDRTAVAARLATIEPKIAALCPAAGERRAVAEPTPTSTSIVSAESPPRPGRGDSRPDPKSSPVRRPLRIAGGTVLGLGLALGGGMVAALVRGASLQNQADELNTRHQGQAIDSADASTFTAIVRHGELADHRAIGLGAAAGALSIAGAMLLVLDARRSKGARFAVQPQILPTAGIRFAMEF